MYPLEEHNEYWWHSSKITYTSNRAQYNFNFLGVGWEHTHFVHELLFDVLSQPLMTDDERGTVCEMRINRGNQSTWRKIVPISIGTPQILHNLTWDWTQAIAVGSWQLSVWAVAWPTHSIKSYDKMDITSKEKLIKLDYQNLICITVIKEKKY